MRVIAGTAKGTQLVAPKGRELRPTTDRVKQVLFDTLLSIQPLPNRALDLFSGTGALGIEALSRGAEEVFFVEKSSIAAQYISKNLARTHLEHRGNLLVADAFLFLRHAASHAFALIFADPPYGKRMAQKLVGVVASHDILAPAGMLVLEETKRSEIFLPENLALIRTKQCGDTALLFVRKNG